MKRNINVSREGTPSQNTPRNREHKPASQRQLWSQVDLARKLAWIHPDQAKARKAIGVPLNVEAVHLIRKQIGKHPILIFSFKGNPIKQVSTKAWYKG